MSVVEPGGGDVPEIPDGLYKARVTAVKDITLEQPDTFGNQEKVEIHLAFKDSDDIDQTLEPRVNRKWGDRATLFAIALACGLDVQPHESFETQSLVGCQVNVLVETPEEGRWPRVKSWGRVKTASARSTKATEPSERKPGVLLPDGTVDWTIVWKEVKRLGMTRESVAAQFDGDITKLTDMDGIDVAVWLDELQSVTA